MNILWQHLSDPEYLHILINPMPVYGLAVGVLALALALVLRNQRVTIAALILVFVCALSAWPTYYYGEAGYDRVKAMSDPAGEQWLDILTSMFPTRATYYQKSNDPLNRSQQQTTTRR